MRWCGVDLAAEAARTAVAVLVEDGAGPRVESVRIGADDDAIIEAILAADCTGVDVPFGWPDAFVATITAHHAGAMPAPESTGIEWRREHALRLTDRLVHRRTGRTPLSVSTDRIGLPALRWAGISAALADTGLTVRRDGSGQVHEVYPAGALAIWGLPHRGYKGAANARVRTRLVNALSAVVPDLDWGPHRATVERSDDALDAVIAALIARSHAAGQTLLPELGQRDRATREGWICLPLNPTDRSGSAPTGAGPGDR